MAFALVPGGLNREVFVPVFATRLVCAFAEFIYRTSVDLVSDFHPDLIGPNRYPNMSHDLISEL
jgi:hypothetical protein